jgi:hypothetical protein
MVLAFAGTMMRMVLDSSCQTTRCHHPHAGDPVFQRQLCLSREAAADWIARLRARGQRWMGIQPRVDRETFSAHSAVVPASAQLRTGTGTTTSMWCEGSRRRANQCEAARANS